MERIRRLRGVTWEWRPGSSPVRRDGREAGVIAQDVATVYPELVERAPNGYLRVDYGGLALKLKEAIVELGDRLKGVEPDSSEPSDPVETALGNLRSGELRPIDHTALVGTLVEAVKELDRRLSEIELTER